jgi:hypothetical protein
MIMREAGKGGRVLQEETEKTEEAEKTEKWGMRVEGKDWKTTNGHEWTRMDTNFRGRFEQKIAKVAKEGGREQGGGIVGENGGDDEASPSRGGMKEGLLAMRIGKGRKMGAASGGGVVVPLLVGVALVVMGGLASGYLVWAWQRASLMNSWVETGCTVLSSGMEEYRHRDTERPRYRWEIQYGYEFEGERYVSERAKRLDVVSGHREKVEGWMARYPTGMETRCWVNPEGPAEAVLKKSTRASIYTLWFPLVFFVGGGVRVWRSVRGVEKAEKLKS